MPVSFSRQLSAQPPLAIDDPKTCYTGSSRMSTRPPPRTLSRTYPAEYGTCPVDLHYGWGLSRREIAALLDWSSSKVSQRLTRAVSLLKYELHPEAFRKAEGLLNREL